MFGTVEDRFGAASDKATSGETLNLLWKKLKRLPVNNLGVSVIKLDAVTFKEDVRDDDLVRFLVGSHPNLLLETMLDILDSRVEGSSIFGLGSNPSCPTDVLLRIRNWQGNSVIPGGVVDSLCSPGWVREIQEGDDYYVKTKIAQNVLTKPEVLEQLAAETHWSVREAVAANPNSPANLLEALGDDKDHRVLWSLMNNPSVSLTVAVSSFLKSKKFVPVEAQKLNVPSRILVSMLQEGFPGTHEGMPREWLWELWDSTVTLKGRK